MNTLYYGDNLDVMRKIRDETDDLCYIDPPLIEELWVTSNMKSLAAAAV